MKLSRSLTSLLLCSLMLAAGCSIIPESKKIEYKSEGKKIRLKDGFSALASLARHSFGPSRPKQGRP